MKNHISFIQYLLSRNVLVYVFGSKHTHCKYLNWYIYISICIIVEQSLSQNALSLDQNAKAEGQLHVDWDINPGSVN